MTTAGSEVSAVTPVRRFKFFETVLSDIGRRRKENQDAYGIAHSKGVSLYVVADGMGGARGGGTASAIAVNVILSRAFEDNGSISISSLRAATELANKAIFARSAQDEELSGMGTTVVALAFVDDIAIVSHVGDSRIYYLRDEKLEQLTRDHTLVQELVDTGAIPLKEAANHPIAHMLTRSLGPADEVEVEIRRLPDSIKEQDKFLLCSDGLYNLVSDEEICSEMSKNSPEEAAKVLVEMALERGGTDNVTVEIMEVLDLDNQSEEIEYPEEDGALDRSLSTHIEVSDVEQLIENIFIASEDSAELEEGETSEISESEERLSERSEEQEEERISEEAPSVDLDDDIDEEQDELSEIEESLDLTEDVSEPVSDDVERESAELPDIAEIAEEHHAAQREIKNMWYVVAFMAVAVIGVVLYSLRQTGLFKDTEEIGEVSSSVSSESGGERNELTQELASWSLEENLVLDSAVSSDGETEEASPDVSEEMSSEEAVANTALEPTVEQIAEILGTGEKSSSSDREVPSSSAGEKKLQSEKRKLSVPPGFKIKKEESESSEEKISSADAEIAETKAKVNDLTVPPPAVVVKQDDLGVVESPTQPIVWENEARKIARLALEEGLLDGTVDRGARKNAELKPTPSVHVQAEQAEVQPTAKPKVKPTSKPEVKPTVTPEVKPTAKPEVTPSAKPEVTPSAKPEVKPSAETEVEGSVRTEKTIISVDKRPAKRKVRKILRKKEKLEVIEKKKEIRTRIADLDRKLEIVGLSDKKAIEKKNNELQDELGKIERAVASTKKEISSTSKQLGMWQELKQEAVGKKRLKLVDQVARFDEDLKEKKKEYSKVSMSYLEAVDRWQEEPNNARLGSLMASLLRTLDSVRTELEKEVVLAIEKGEKKATESLAEHHLTLENLERRRDGLNRHFGYLEGFAAMSDTRKKELGSEYLKERNEQVEELDELRELVSDEEEASLKI